MPSGPRPFDEFSRVEWPNGPRYAVGVRAIRKPAYEYTRPRTGLVLSPYGVQRQDGERLALFVERPVQKLPMTLLGERESARWVVREKTAGFVELPCLLPEQALHVRCRRFAPRTSART